MNEGGWGDINIINPTGSSRLMSFLTNFLFPQSWFNMLIKIFQKSANQKGTNCDHRSRYGVQRYLRKANGFTNILPRISMFSWWTISTRPIGREKQNLAPFLLVEIKLFIKKTIKLLFRCFLFCKSITWWRREELLIYYFQWWK